MGIWLSAMMKGDFFLSFGKCGLHLLPANLQKQLCPGFLFSLYTPVQPEEPLNIEIVLNVSPAVHPKAREFPLPPLHVS